MGGRKFRLSTYRKNAERKRTRENEEKLAQLPLIVAIPRQLVAIPPLTISLPIESYLEATSSILRRSCLDSPHYPCHLHGS